MIDVPCATDPRITHTMPWSNAICFVAIMALAAWIIYLGCKSLNKALADFPICDESVPVSDTPRIDAGSESESLKSITMTLPYRVSELPKRSDSR